MTYNLYADLILLNNFTMDFLLLSTVRKMMKLEVRKGGIWLASLAGALYALAVMIVPLPVFFLQTFVTCAGMSTLMVVLAFRIKKLPEIVRAVGGLYMAAILAAGIMEFFRSFGWFSVFWLYAAAALGSMWMISFLWSAVFSGMTRSRRMYRVEIDCGGRKKELTALLDTGNHLKDPISGKPVSIVPASEAGDLFQGQVGVRLVPFKTVGCKDGLLPAFLADRMVIHMEGLYQVIEKPCIAVSREPLSQDHSYQMLLNETFWL